MDEAGRVSGGVGSAGFKSALTLAEIVAQLDRALCLGGAPLPLISREAWPHRVSWAGRLIDEHYCALGLGRVSR
jgi:hypothetical protein